MSTRLLILAGALGLFACVPSVAQDADGDGLLEAHEEILGTNPQAREVLQVVINDGPESAERRRAEGYDPTKDVLTVEFCHVAQDRYLWRATFAEAPRLEDTVFHLYVDADADAATGRKGPAGTTSTGTEYMLSVVGGNPTSSYYATDGTGTSGPRVSFVTAGSSLLVSADIELGRDDKGIRYALYVLCHTTTQSGQPAAMTDSTGKKLIEGIPVMEREKIMRPGDYTTNYNVTATYGLDSLRALLRDEATLEVRHDQLDCDGFVVDVQTSRRFPHVKVERQGGRVSAAPPRPGRYYVGFMMYDDSRDERVIIRVNDEFAGLAVANQNNNRTWLYYLSEARDFKAGDVVSLEAAGSSGKHAICNLLFFPKPPPTRAIEYRVENTEWTVPVGTEGKVSLSWTTTWPSDTKFEYGATTNYGQTATEQCSRLVHKVRLQGLKPDLTYHGRAVGTTPDGTAYYGPDIAFTATALEPPPTKAGVTRVPLTVRNPHDAAARWPVTVGVPFPRGMLGDAAHVRLTRSGKEVLAQVKPTGAWSDGSVKWVLVTLMTDVPAAGQTRYTLEFGRRVAREVTEEPMARREGDRVLVDTGALRFAIDSHGQIVNLAHDANADGTYSENERLLAPGAACASMLVDSTGATYRNSAGSAEVKIEENGPLRAVIETVGNLSDGAGKQSFRVEQRIEAYRGAPFLRVHHTFVNDRPEEFTNIESLSYHVPIAGGANWRAPLVDGDPLILGRETDTVRQRFDNEFVLGRGAAQGAAGRIVGALVSEDARGCAVAVRDFWQQYPKGFALANDGVRIDLCPDFEAGLYDKFPFEKEGHQLYYYLLDGHYRFKRGMAKTHELFLCFAPPAARAGLCQLFQRPPLLTASPEWYCDSKAFYSVAPRDEKRFKAYEQAINANLKAYTERRDRQRDYGMMNYGDWYGERGSNWGNIEYDTQHAFFLEYIRSGNPEAFFLGESTELHNRDIDTVHWSPDRHETGAVYIHQMCHVGGYYSKSVPGTQGFPKAGYTVSHAWVEGHFDHYFLTGDHRSLETGMAVADFFINRDLSRPYDFTSCRVPGWQLIMNAAALAATNDPYYLNASRVVVDRVLETQDKEPRPLPEYQREPGRTHQVGGWSRMMVPGHCQCEPRHRGNAGFMVAILLSGLKYYHDVTEEPAVRRAIIRGAHYLLDECYSDEIHGFRYTSCPKTGYRAGATPLMVEGISRAYLWTKDARFKDVLTNGLAAGAGGSGYGKGFSMYYRCAPRVLADLAACGLSLEQRRVALVPFTPPEWMARLKKNDRIVIQAEDFNAQGEGEVQIRDDRHATWGTMITYWHEDVGHWLEWTFNVPKSAEYRALFRYATSSPKPVRTFELDGTVPHSDAAAIEFEPTGGFGNNPDDWQFHALKYRDGNDVAIPLERGRHTIRMTNLGDGLGLDFILLVRVQ